MNPVTLTVIATDPGCTGGECPTVYRGSDGKIYVQGTLVAQALKEAMSLPEGEDIVAIPESLIAAIRGAG